MAIFEKEKQEAKEYLAMLDVDGEVVAFVHPVKGVSNEVLVGALASKGVNVEVREPKGDKVAIKL